MWSKVENRIMLLRFCISLITIKGNRFCISLITIKENIQDHSLFNQKLMVSHFNWKSMDVTTW